MKLWTYRIKIRIKDTRLPARVEYEANGNAGWFTALPIGYKTFTFKIEGKYEKYTFFFQNKIIIKRNLIIITSL